VDHSYCPCSDELLTTSFGNIQVSGATCGCDAHDEESHPFTQSLEQLQMTSPGHSSRNSYYKCFDDEYTLGSCDQVMSSVSETTTLIDTTLSTMWSESELDSLNEDSSSFTTGSRHSSSGESTQSRVSFATVTKASWYAHVVKYLRYCVNSYFGSCVSPTYIWPMGIMIVQRAMDAVLSTANMVNMFLTRASYAGSNVSKCCLL